MSLCFGRISRCLTFAMLIGLAAGSVLAQDWPQWQGANRDSEWNEPRLLDEFPEDGLAVVWRKPVGSGFGGPAVVDGHVYTLGAEGRMMCLRADDGSILWNVDLKERYGLKEAPIWGFAAHPLVHGRMVYTMVGGEEGAAIALDRETGGEIWRACPSKAAGYCPPMIIEAGGAEQLVIWNPDTINGVNPETGEVWWSFPLAPDYDMPIAAPTLHGDLLYACGEGTASILIRLAREKPAAEEVWSGRGFNTSHSPVLLGEGHAYGVDLGGKLRCIALEDGKRKWDTEEPTCGGSPSSSGCAFIVRCGDRYLIAGEHGTLTLARMTPEKYEAISAAQIIEPTQDAFGKKVIWSHPAFANGCCYWKNDREIVCVSLVKPEAAGDADGE